MKLKFRILEVGNGTIHKTRG